MRNDRHFIATLLGAAMVVLVVLVLAPNLMPMPEQSVTSSSDNPRAPILTAAGL